MGYRMATITFDTLQLVDKLKAAGFPPDQAEAVVRAIGQAQSELVTKADLDFRKAPPQRAGELAASWGLEPPWRRVTLFGAAVRPELAVVDAAEAVDPSVAFGPPLDDRFVPALRRGLVLVVEREAITTLLEPPAALLELSALPVYALEADGLEVTWEGRLLLRGSRGGAPDAVDGRNAWLTDEPAADRWTGLDNERHGLVRDLVVNLSRQPILAALPRQLTPDPLRQDGRVGIKLTFGSDQAARVRQWELGWLREPAGTLTAAMWTAGDGRLVAIPDALLVTIRNAAGLIAPRQ